VKIRMNIMHFLGFIIVGAITLTRALNNVEQQAATTPEAMFRATLIEYRAAPQSRNSVERWSMWSQLATDLMEATTQRPPLDIIAALEESILVIEQAVFQAGEADDPPRDRMLAHLYYAYGRTLQSLSSQDCTRLALDERTLLIGAETVDASKPSQHLCRENAENALRNAATLDATHVEAANLLAELLQQDGAEGVHKRKPKEFVAELFDSFAATFDSKLGSLGYRVPGLVGKAAASLSPSGYTSALDAGCGTGLAGRYLRPLVRGALIGVDASQKMLDIAAKCTTTSGCGLEEDKAESTSSEPLYDGLFAMDLEEMTLENTLRTPRVKPLDDVTAFDLVVAADVLVYFGRLDIILQTFASVSSPDSHLIFSCERASQEEAPLGFRLLSSGRFAHTKTHGICT